MSPSNVYRTCYNVHRTPGGPGAQLSTTKRDYESREVRKERLKSGRRLKSSEKEAGVRSCWKFSYLRIYVFKDRV